MSAQIERHCATKKMNSCGFQKQRRVTLHTFDISHVVTFSVHMVSSSSSSSSVYFPSKYHVDSFHSTEKSINGNPNKYLYVCSKKHHISMKQKHFLKH